MRHALLSVPALIGAACAAPEAPVPDQFRDTARAADTATGCAVLFDLTDPAAQGVWSVQNDTVMGGNSLGRLAQAGALVFDGRLVTRGGGFVQVNAPLPEGALAGAAALRITGRSEGRPWRVRLQTDQRVARSAMRGRGPITQVGPDMDGPLVSFSAPIRRLGRNETAVGTADLTRVEASMRGRAVEGAAFDASQARSIGLILADGEDAPFTLRVERIEACR